MSLRVIAGELRGRLLAVPPGRTSRPTSNRVKEALFSSVQAALSGARVLDLYAGSGALGIEALSRGAAVVVFVERSPACLKALERNLDNLGLASRSRVLRRDVLVALRGLGSDPAAPFDLVLFDPPYGSPELPHALAVLASEGLLAAEGTVVVESSRRHPVGAVSGLVCEREKAYGDTVLSRWRISGQAGRAAEGAEESNG